MIAGRMFSRSEILKFLEPFNCTLIEEEKNNVLTGYGWYYFRTAWGFHFYVPGQGPDNRCPADRLIAILGDLAKRSLDQIR
jgi:hypothetical protein